MIRFVTSIFQIHLKMSLWKILEPDGSRRDSASTPASRDPGSKIMMWNWSRNPKDRRSVTSATSRICMMTSSRKRNWRTRPRWNGEVLARASHASGAPEFSNDYQQGPHRPTWSQKMGLHLSAQRLAAPSHSGGTSRIGVLHVVEVVGFTNEFNKD